MGKDLIIGGASNYGWNELKYWVNSIKKSGFDGDIVLVATNIKRETIEKLNEEGVQLQLYGKMQDDGSVVAHSNGVPHVERFFYMWNYLRENVDKYDYVISTDTRDVVFQSNPTVWIDEMIFAGRESLIVSSEGLKYQDEPWGNQNLFDAFGPYFHNLYKSIVINNVGVIAGETRYVTDLFFMIFQMSINRPYNIVDQAVYNILLQQKPFSDICKFTYNSDAWAIQLGTTIEAIKNGAGAIGNDVRANPEHLKTYEANYFDEQPIFENGIVKTAKGAPFVVVHQYDRLPIELKNTIMEKYA